ncbi:uncharacterized protein LOC122462373 [Chelonia mydas]|uniref:uncharacterized protein LOC122462373 n=1 Tax=Chelonia mydas TaxID=8469 RepID=UPI001CA7EF8E|nr:uncharacterized protein LOC122462373 [Chelonia mydas]
MNRQFVEDRAVAIDPLPFIWNVKGPGPHYCLDMKMSRLKRLAFAFEFGSVNPRQSFPVTEFPERIVKLDISLNELEELQPEALFPFENLFDLDASLNALGIIRGVEVLPNLVVLNLSHNALSDLRSLETCIHLSVLNVSHNQVRALGDMPRLSHLTRLHLGSNKVFSTLHRWQGTVMCSWAEEMGYVLRVILGILYLSWNFSQDTGFNTSFFEKNDVGASTTTSCQE